MCESSPSGLAPPVTVVLWRSGEMLSDVPAAAALLQAPPPGGIRPSRGNDLVSLEDWSCCETAGLQDQAGKQPQQPALPGAPLLLPVAPAPEVPPFPAGSGLPARGHA